MNTVMVEDFALVEPATRYRRAFLAMLDDYRRAGEERYGNLRNLTPPGSVRMSRTCATPHRESDFSQGGFPIPPFGLSAPLCS